MVNGTIVRNAYNEGGYGNYIIIKDNETGMGFLYGHMRERSPLAEGSQVVIGQYVGHEGATGHVTGIHVHVEMQDISSHDWQFNQPVSAYENPADYMGFPNTTGISVIYDGTPITPPEPTPTENEKKKFPWVLYAKKLRQKRTIL